jgi:xanthine dehydrogenase accessory factor
LLLLDCSLFLCDDRKEWIDKLPQNSKLKVYHCDYLDFINKIKFNSLTQVIVMTRGHQTDFPILKEILLKDYDFNYIGVLGSPVKSKKIKSELKDAGVKIDKIQKLRCPMGLEMGSNQPSEIALSISAEVLRCRDLISAESKTV